MQIVIDRDEVYIIWSQNFEPENFVRLTLTNSDSKVSRNFELGQSLFELVLLGAKKQPLMDRLNHISGSYVFMYLCLPVWTPLFTHKRMDHGVSLHPHLLLWVQ